MRRVVPRKHGFTLLELVTVIGISGITATLALPGLHYVKERKGGEYDTEYLAEKIYSLRKTAQQSNSSVRLNILPVHNASGLYRLKAYRSVGAIERSTCYYHVFEETLFDIEWDLKSGYQVYSESSEGICFYPDGSASGATIYMTDAEGSYTQKKLDQASEAEEGEPQTFTYIATDARPGDFMLHIHEQSIRSKIDIPLATGIPDITKTASSL